MASVPYMLIIGDKELEAQQVSLRSRAGEDFGMMTIDSICDKMRHSIDVKD